MPNRCPDGFGQTMLRQKSFSLDTSAGAKHAQVWSSSSANSLISQATCSGIVNVMSPSSAHSRSSGMQSSQEFGDLAGVIAITDPVKCLPLVAGE